MKRISWATAVILLSTVSSTNLFWSCSKQQNGDNYESLASRCDSFQNMIDSQNLKMEEYAMFLDEISACIDSITTAENTFLINVDTETGRPYSRPTMKARVNQFQKILSDQRDKISELSLALEEAQNPEEVNKLKRIIEYLNEQLELKDAQLEELKQDLSRSNHQRVQLSHAVNTLTQDVSTLKRENERKETTIVRQQEQINLAYVKIGTKKELSEEGFIETGFLKKTKVALTGIDKSRMTQVDVKLFTSVDLPSKRPKILTNMPVNSYSIVRNGDSSCLTIDDPSTFWSLSNILIIQL